MVPQELRLESGTKGKRQTNTPSQERNRRATRPPAHFQRNPLGRGDITIICETVH
jgi:hypothetical protein